MLLHVVVLRTRLDLFKEAESSPKAKFDNNCDVLRVTPAEIRRYLVL